MSIFNKFISAGCAILLVGSLGGCATWNSLTSAQKVQLTATIVNGVCLVTAAGLQIAAIDNSIINPNATTGGSGQSAAGTLQKANSLTAANCAAINGALATLSGNTALK